MTSCFSPLSVSIDWNLSNSMPVSTPFSMMNRTGCRFSMISTPSSSASSSSHGEALKYFRVLRAMTFTSVAPSRFDGPAAVHRRVADADDQHALADRVDVAEVDRLEPVDADEDLVGVVPAGNLQLLAFRRAAADEHCVEPALVEQRLQAVDRRVVADVHAHVDDVADLLVEDLLGQPERRDVDPHQAAGSRQLLEDRGRVAERHQVVGDRQRRWTRADEGDLLPVLFGGCPRQQVLHLPAIVGGDALQPADGNRLPIDAPAPAGRLARPIARAPQDPREHVRFPIEHVSVGETALGDEADVLGDVGVGRTGPLAVDDPVVVVRIANVGWTHRVVIIGR